MIIIQLQTLSGVAKGLTRTADSLFFDESPTEQLQTGRMERARADPRMVKLRDDMFSAISTTLEYWSTDAGVSDVRCAFPFAMTSGSLSCRRCPSNYAGYE